LKKRDNRKIEVELHHGDHWTESTFQGKQNARRDPFSTLSVFESAPVFSADDAGV
jgi:hypothetical protein